jgi:hypothetical protein
MKHLIFSISLLALVSCKDSKNQETDQKKDTFEESTEITKEHHEHETSGIYTNAWTSEINLNNGSKWQANAETNEGVKKMEDVLKTFKTTTIDDYHELANQLNSSKNFVIKNCTMKGDSHDNLHVWLLPLMDKIEALSEVKAIDEAAKLKQSIYENVNAYNTYFQ